MKSNTVEVRVGRLMEIRAGGFQSVADVERQRSMIARGLNKLAPDQLVVIAADWRDCSLMTAEAADALGPMIGYFNSRVARAAMLARDDSPTAVLQFLRVVRETKHPNRRVFHDVDHMSAWLGDVLTAPEAVRLGMFLAEKRHSP